MVVCEADNDRAFYDEIYHRISGMEEGRPSVLFINAESKQTVKDIVGPLRDMGVPAAAIVDIDIVRPLHDRQVSDSMCQTALGWGDGAA